MTFAAAEAETTLEVYTSLLPLWAILVPMVGSCLVYLAGLKSDKLRNLLAVLTALVTFLLVLGHYPLIREGIVEFHLLKVMEQGLWFRVDMLSFIFALIISLVWLLATIFSTVYMSYEHAQNRYYLFLLFTLGACLGVVLTGDLFTLFLFFELMTFSSYVLVIHEEDEEAIAAGRLYLYLGVAGGLSLLLGILLLYHGTGTLAIAPLMEELAHSEINLTAVLVAFVIGFGIKAGMVPLHIWLPKAHPVAPSPASALLSGIMIKAGAYGILRILLTVYAPAHLEFFEEAGHHLLYSQQAGYWVIWIGIVTMFLGACMALLSNHAKRILAYSSVSQMGYILMGIGAAAYLGAEGAIGFAGAVYHIFNHAFFKSGLFLMVGAVYIYTRDLDITRVRGMIRKFPVVAVAFLVAAFGISGMPGFNGYASKTLLHDAMLEAIALYGGFGIYLAERMFVVTSAITICYFAKLFRGLFLGPVPEKFNREIKVHPLVNAVVIVYAGIITAIGMFPNYVLEKLILPAAELFTYDPHGVEHLVGFHFFDPHPLEAMGVVALLAVGIYVVGSWRKWFDWRPPRWLSIQYLLYFPLCKRLLSVTENGGTAIEKGVNGFYFALGRAGLRVCSYFGLLDSGLNDAYESTGRAARKLADGSETIDSNLNSAYEESGRAVRRLADKGLELEQGLNDAYDKTGALSRQMAEGGRRLDEGLNQGYEDGGKAARKAREPSQTGRKGFSFNPTEWNIKNLNFDSLLMAVMLGIVLLILFLVFTG